MSIRNPMHSYSFLWFRQPKFVQHKRCSLPQLFYMADLLQRQLNGSCESKTIHRTLIIFFEPPQKIRPIIKYDQSRTIYSFNHPK